MVAILGLHQSTSSPLLLTPFLVFTVSTTVIL
jgi:hypothetical protein